MVIDRGQLSLSRLVRDSSSPSLIPPLYTCTRHGCRTSSPLTSLLMRDRRVAPSNGTSSWPIPPPTPASLSRSQIAVSRDPDEGDHPPVLKQPPQDITYAACTRSSSSSIQRCNQGLTVRGYQGAVPSFSLLQPLHCLPHCRGLGSVRATQRTGRSWPTVHQVIAPVYRNTVAPVLHSASRWAICVEHVVLLPSGPQHRNRCSSLTVQGVGLAGIRFNDPAGNPNLPGRQAPSSLVWWCFS